MNNSGHILPELLVSNANGCHNLMKRIGNMIIGVSNKGRNNQEGKKSYTYLTSIINGDIDADKLDYIKRDSYTSGLPLTFDIERLLYKITIKEHGTSGDYQLVVDMAGITAVEEITFSKLMLNNYIYHHHKVLATEVMAKDIGLALMELGYINHPCDFYNYTDKKIEALIDSDERPFISYGDNISLGYLVKRVKDRYLPKRCFEINSRVLEALPLDKKQEKEQEKDYVKNCLNEIEKANSFEEKEVALLSFAASKFEFSNKNENQISQFQKFISEFGKKTYNEYTQWIRKDIYKKICELYSKASIKPPKNGISIFNVHMVIPKSIDEQTGFTTPIVYRNDSDHYANNMLSYTKNWAQAFNSNKWSGYIFVSSHIDISIAFEASRLVLQEYIPGVVFNHPEEFIKRVDESILNKLRK